jgi:hypothetical protein
MLIALPRLFNDEPAVDVEHVPGDERGHRRLGLATHVADGPADALGELAAGMAATDHDIGARRSQRRRDRPAVAARSR